MQPYYQDELVTIFNADCRDVLPGLENKSIDLIVTDPPYGHNNNDGDLISRWEEALGKGKAGESRPIANDGPEANELFRYVMTESRRLLKGGGCCCCCGGGGGPDPQFARWSLWMDELLGFKHAVVWDKGGLGMGWHYRRNYEFILVGQMPGGACKWYGGDSVPNVVRIDKIIPRGDQHPTPKPVPLMAFFIRNHSLPGDAVLDPFLGAGTTALAAKKLGRRCIGVELSERWCEQAAIACHWQTVMQFDTPTPQPTQLTLEATDA